MIRILHFSMLFALSLFILPMDGISQQKDWTYIVYLIGADLESKSDAGTNDIFEIIDAGATDNVNVVVLTGGADKDGWRVPNAQLYNNGEEVALDYNAGGKQMTSAENVTAFIDWTLTNYPANKVALTFWNHGSDIRGYGNDEVSGVNLPLPKIKEALQNTQYVTNNNKFELLGFDACLMGNLETVSTLGDFANWYVGSEEQEPGHGWNYTPIIQAMNSADTDFSGSDLGKVIVDGFIAQATEQETDAVTLGVINTEKVPALENSLTALFDQLVSDGTVSQLHKARAKAEEYSKSINNPEYSEDMVDIGDLMKKFKTIDPSYSAMIDDVLAKLAETVVYSKNDMARPRSTGLAMYIPHNVLVDENELYTILDNHYYNIDFKLEIRDFIYDHYTPQALADNNPPSGTLDPDFVLLKENGKDTNHRGSELVSAIRVDDNDLEQIQILLIEELQGFPDEYLMLGSTHADTVVIDNDGVSTYAYLWDDQWIGINGYPAYISDIHEYDMEDENGVVLKYTQVHIPAVKNLETDTEEFLILTYRFDEDFNYVLESIIPEPYTDATGQRIVPKQRVQLQPGDNVQLLYEGFNEVTDEEFLVVNDDNIITIVDGNDDLELGYDLLEPGNYQIGFLLEDHSQNDTLIFEPAIYTVLGTGVETITNDNYFEIYPNPAGNMFTIEMKDLKGDNFDVMIFDYMGRLVHQQKGSQQIMSLDLGLTNGIYTVEIIQGNTRVLDKLVIQK